MNRSVVVHVVSYCGGTSVGNGCGGGGQTGGGRGRRQRLSSQRDHKKSGRRMGEPLSGWSKLKANFAWVRHFIKWVTEGSMSISELKVVAFFLRRFYFTPITIIWPMAKDKNHDKSFLYPMLLCWVRNKDTWLVISQGDGESCLWHDKFYGPRMEIH